MLLWPDVGVKNFLDNFIADRLATSAMKWRVFANDLVPDESTILADLVEASWTGYLPVAGSTISWSSVIVSGHVAGSTGSPVNFYNNSATPKIVYGIYITDNAGMKLYAIERDPAAPVEIDPGQIYTYTPNQQAARFPTL